MKKSRLQYEKQHAHKARIWPVSFFTHARRNRHLKTNIIGWKDNEGETIFTPSTQAKLLKEFYSFIFREGDESTATSLPTVVKPVPQFSTPVVHRELSSLDISKETDRAAIRPRMVRRLADFFGWTLFSGGGTNRLGFCGLNAANLHENEPYWALSNEKTELLRTI